MAWSLPRRYVGAFTFVVGAIYPRGRRVTALLRALADASSAMVLRWRRRSERGALGAAVERLTAGLVPLIAARPRSSR